MKLLTTVERSRIEKALYNPPVPPLSAVDCIKLAFEKHPGKVTVSWSGGKCSTAVLFIARDLNPRIPVVWNNTGVHFPETIEFVRKLTKEWNFNLIEIKPSPEHTFWKCVEIYGFPMIRGKYLKTSKSKDGRPKCCQWLKEDPFKRFIKESGYEATLTGLRASESRMRMFGIAQFGQYYFAKKHECWRYHPIAFWSQKQLDNFHKENGIPVNKVYEMGHKRCGCWTCTGYLSWRENIRESHPKLYRFLSKKTGQPTLWEYLENETCLDFLKSEGLI